MTDMDPQEREPIDRQSFLEGWVCARTGAVADPLAEAQEERLLGWVATRYARLIADCAGRPVEFVVCDRKQHEKESAL